MNGLRNMFLAMFLEFHLSLIVLLIRFLIESRCLIGETPASSGAFHPYWVAAMGDLPLSAGHLFRRG